MENEKMIDTIKAVVFGHAVGDALGVPVEFSTRSERNEDPVSEMRGFEMFPVPAGSWSDDTSLSLCALDVLADGKLDYERIMENFGRWYYNDAFTPTGMAFDVGNTCRKAIENYIVSHKDIGHCGMTDEQSNGNGSLMRIYPFVLYYCLNWNQEEDIDQFEMIEKASSLTHAHPRAIIGCRIFLILLENLILFRRKDSVYESLRIAGEVFSNDPEVKVFQRLFEKDFDKLPRCFIHSSGYIVDTLEAAVWCLLTTDSYRDCVLKAVNLGSDTDSVAAVAGALAGALYGYDAIPKEWLNTLRKREWIEKMCERAEKNWAE